MDAGAWNERYATNELIWSDQPNRFVAEELAGRPAGRALDLGTGEGRNAVWLARQGWRVLAVDFSSVALDKGRAFAARLKVAHLIEWQEADVSNFTPRPAHFDLVLLSYLHLPVDALATVLRNAAQALVPGGILLAVGHDRANLEQGIGGPQQPEILYEPGALRELLATAGLSVSRAETRERATPEGVALDTFVLAVAKTEDNKDAASS